MKKLLILLLAIMSLQVHGQTVKIGDTTYFPRISDNGAIVYRPVGFFVIPPTNYNPAKQYPLKQIVHGVGERSEGKLEHLRNLAQGAVYTKGGPRLYPFVTPDLARAINDSQFIAVIPTYGDQFQPADINYVFDEVIRNYSVDQSRLELDGFSYGGGAVTRYVTSSLANAQRIALAVACAPVNWATNYTYVRDAELPVIVITATKDDKVNPVNGKNFADGINALNPKIKAKLIVLPYDGHAGLTEVLEIYNKYIPQNTYGFLKQITNTIPKQYPITTTSTLPPVVQPPTTVKADFNLTEGQVITTSAIELDASSSVGAKDYYWEVTRMDFPWVGHKLQGGTVGGPKKVVTNLVDGPYTVRLTINSIVKSDVRAFTAKIGNPVPEPRKAISFDSSTDLITYSDGSTEPGKATFSNGAWVVKNSAGLPIQF